MRIKEQALAAIASLPDDALIEEIMYPLYVIDKVAKGQDDIVNGKTITTVELFREIESW